MSLIASDPFARPDGPFTTPWTPATSFYSGSGVHQVPTIKNFGYTVIPGVIGVGNGMATNSAVLPANQYSRCVAKSVGNNATTDVQVGIGCRATADGLNGYLLVYGPNSTVQPAGCIEFWKVVAGSFTQLSGTIVEASVPGDIYEIWAIGNVILGLKNNVVRFAVVDNSLSSGLAAISAWTANGAVADQNTVASQWDAGSITLTQNFADPFNRADGAIGANYTNIENALLISSQQVIGSNTAGNNNGEFTGLASPADQWAQIRVKSFASNNFSSGPSLRNGLLGATIRNYRAVENNNTNTYLIQRRDDNSSSTMATGAITPAVGDILTLIAAKTVFILLQNGAFITSFTDSTYASGPTGISALLAALADDFATGPVTLANGPIAPAGQAGVNIFYGNGSSAVVPLSAYGYSQQILNWKKQGGVWIDSATFIPFSQITNVELL